MNLKNYISLIKKGFKIKNFINYFVVIAVTLIFGLISGIGGLNRSTLALLEQIGYSVIAAVSLSLVVGFLGELSLGHAAFMSLGAFTGSLFQNAVFPSLSSSAPLLSLILAMIIGGIIAGLFGFIIGLPALRLKGDYLAIVTLAFGEIIKIIFQNMDLFGGVMGFQNKYRYDINSLFIVIFVVLLLALAVIQNLIRSKHGRAVMAVRDNEIAAKSMGVNVSYYKIAVFVISAVIAGVAGVLFANTQSTIKSSKFDYNYSINLLVMVVLGGMGNVNGTLLASTVITFIDVKLATILTGDLAVIKNIVYALILIVMVIYNNAPSLKKFRERFNLTNAFNALKKFILTLFNKKKKTKNSAEEVEFGADWSKIPTKIEMDAILSTDLKPDETYDPDVPDKGAKR
ncbi:MAG: branched-chain amino acid ABC transporter permease [Clostridia bacterium]|nr:branched-chain amino acid ABC transporter permease [Clostridia bacterium]